MGRPPKKAGEKRQLIGARFDPTDRHAIETAAEKSGRSAGAEIEARVKATLAFDEEGLRFLAEIGQEILDIQRGLGGQKAWHEDLKKWSAVTHMLRTGPIMRRNPDQPHDDEIVSAAYNRFRELQSERRQLVEAANQSGLAWIEDPAPKKSGSGIFGSKTRLGGILGAAVNKFALDPRVSERSAIEAISDPDAQAAAIEAHDRLRQLDSDVADAREAWSETLQPYWEAEREGRAWNKHRQMKRAQDAFDRGDPVDVYQLSGMDPWGGKD
ncbi:MAG: hypothetical protein VX454_11075 [Pseudomonadota bacterium]|nr:hypothetical protein [Pseudomonadota bacterium]